MKFARTTEHPLIAYMKKWEAFNREARRHRHLWQHIVTALFVLIILLDMWL